MLTRALQLRLVALAARAPSPHNAQPARWRFLGDRVELHEAPERWLAVGDPAGRDSQVALGMAWEGMALALSLEGLLLADVAVQAAVYPPPGPGPRKVAAARLAPGAGPDPLAQAVLARRSHRGTFPAAQAPWLDALDRCLAQHACASVMRHPDTARLVGGWYDEAALEGLEAEGFAEELYRWMRFSPADPRAGRDGLSADCLGLSALEARGAALMLRPAVLRFLLRLGLGGLLVGEARKVRSAARIVLVHRAAEASAFDAGRDWYRLWLALALAGAAGVPMSALADSPTRSARLLRLAPLPAGRSLVNVMRIGPVPPGGSPQSARLPAEELLLEHLQELD